MKIQYVPKRFGKDSLAHIENANMIIEEFAGMGFILTLRQLYYQFVQRILLPNTQKNYKRLGAIVSDARLAGLISWDDIEDRTRSLRAAPTWTNPHNIIKACADWYRVDLWEGQETRPEVWIEKDALIGVIEPICQELRVPYFSCRGYASQTTLFDAGRRMRNIKDPTIFHLGDHDPSGIDMTRDIRARVSMFAEQPVNVVRLALNMDQIEEFDPPPNPAKMTDSRAEDYVRRHGNDSWELDALSPVTIADLIRTAVTEMIDFELWEERQDVERAGAERLREVAVVEAQASWTPTAKVRPRVLDTKAQQSLANKKARDAQQRAKAKDAKKTSKKKASKKKTKKASR